MQIVNQRTELVPIDSVRPHERNVNQGNIGLIGESISHNGFYGSLVVQQSTGHILRGNHTWQAARQAGATEIPVTFVDVDDETALRILLVDNRATREGVDDSNALAVLLQELAGTPAALGGTGYDGDALDELLADLEMAAGPPSLDHLAGTYGEPQESAFWPKIECKVPPDVHARYLALMDRASGDMEHQRLAAVLAWAQECVAATT